MVEVISKTLEIALIDPMLLVTLLLLVSASVPIAINCLFQDEVAT